MNTPKQLASQTSQAIAVKKNALIKEAINKYYGFEASLPFLMYLCRASKFNMSVTTGVETLYIENTPILEIYPVEMVDTDESGVISFDFKYRSLI